MVPADVKRREGEHKRLQATLHLNIGLATELASEVTATTEQERIAAARLGATHFAAAAKADGRGGLAQNIFSLWGEARGPGYYKLQAAS